MADQRMMDQMARHENAGCKNDRPNYMTIAGLKLME